MARLLLVLIGMLTLVACASMDAEDDRATDEAVGAIANELSTSNDTLAEEVFDRQTVEVFLDGAECGPGDNCVPRDATMLGVV